MTVRIADLPTPALCVDLDVLDANVDTMAAVRPGPALRPHVKAFKSTAMARHVVERGVTAPSAARPSKEMEGMVAADVGHDLLLANETLDTDRLAELVRRSTRPVTVAVDSPETVDAAAGGLGRSAGLLAVLVDVNVGLPRCGCRPDDAGAIADRARAGGLVVRGVMGYEGHVVGNPDRAWRVEQVDRSVELLRPRTRRWEATSRRWAEPGRTTSTTGPTRCRPVRTC